MPGDPDAMTEELDPVPLDQDVEAPKASSPFRFRNDSIFSNSLELEGESMRNLVISLRRELLDRLDRQHEVLSLLLKAPSRSKRHSRSSKYTPEVSPAPPPMRSRPLGKTSFTPQLFSTFTQHDLAHVEMANLKDEALQQDLVASPSCRTRVEVKEGFLARVVRSHWFDLVCALVVISNSIFLGVEVEMSISSGGQRNETLQAIQYVYSAWFLVELLVRIAVDGRKLFVGEDWMWGWLDATVVMTSLWEVLLDLMYLMMKTDTTDGEVPGVSGLKALRIIRITRVATWP
eukprot:s5165_g1.t1